MKRIGLIGDVHAEDRFLEAALAHLVGEGVEQILCVGDLSDGKGDLDRCAELLLAHQVRCIRGNHDRWLLANEMRDLQDTQLLAELAPRTRDYLAALPVTLRVETAAGPLLLCHGLGKDDMLFVNDSKDLSRDVDASGRRRLRARAQLGIEPDVRLIVNGHTHVRWAERLGRLCMINAGTLRRDDCPGFALLDLGRPTFRVQYHDLNEAGRVSVAEEVLL